MGSVVLTFDNGPTRETTGRVLDVLRDRELRAGFFVVGALLAETGSRGMDHLEAFLDRLDADGHRFTDTLPASCVPVRCGVVEGDIDGYVTS